MSPVAALIRVLGVRPRLATALPAGPGATALSAARLTPVTPAIGRPVLARMPLTWSGVHSGWAWSIRATAPATIGAAIERPLAPHHGGFALLSFRWEIGRCRQV